MRASTESASITGPWNSSAMYVAPSTPILPASVEDEVLAEHAGLELAVVGDLHRVGHLEPQLARRHRRSAVGGADAGGEHVDRTVRAGVAVAADHEIAGHHVTRLGDELVAHAAADVVDLGAGLLAELAHHRVQRAHALDRARARVVHDQRDLGRVEDLLDAHVLERADGKRRGAVLAHHEVDVRDDDVARVRIGSGVCREDLLGDRLAGIGITSLRCSVRLTWRTSCASPLG